VDSWFPEEEIASAPPLSTPTTPSDRPLTTPDAEWQSDLRQRAEYHPPQPDDYFVDPPQPDKIDIRLDPRWQALEDETRSPEPSNFKMTYAPPPIANPPRQVRRPPVDPPVVEETARYHRSQFEVPQTPKTETRQGTIYSYTYKEPRHQAETSPPEPPEEKPDAVFDVNYRLLNPPTRPTEDLEGEDEEWL
jgi:hypothetical protein